MEKLRSVALKHRKIWKLNVADGESEEVKWKLNGFLRDKNFSSEIISRGFYRGKTYRRQLVDKTAINFYDLRCKRMSSRQERVVWLCLHSWSNHHHHQRCRYWNAHRMWTTDSSIDAINEIHHRARAACGFVTFGMRDKKLTHMLNMNQFSSFSSRLTNGGKSNCENYLFNFFKLEKISKKF